MTASSTPGESRQRAATIIQQLRDFGEMGPEGGNCDTLIEVFSSMAREAADALAKAEARIAEVERENAELMKALYEAERLADDRGREHTAAFMEDTSDGRHAVAAAECAHIAEGIKALRAARLVSEPHGVKAPDHG